MSEPITELVDETFRLAGALRDAGERLAAVHGLTVARWRILGRLGDEGPGSVAEIARRCGLTRQSARESAERLHRDGLIAREPDPDDARAPIVTLTPAGRAALRAIEVDRARWARRAGAALASVDVGELAARTRDVRVTLQSADV